MKYLWLDDEQLYDGRQLSSLYAYLNYNLLGDSILSWAGPCDVKLEHMVDGEDLNAKAKICSDQMIHFVIEYFESDLFFGVAIQRIFAAIVIDVLKELSNNTDLTQALFRQGDDVFVDDQKFSISVATKSPTSILVHFAVNVVNAGTPVKTISLSDFAVDPKEFSMNSAQLLINEIKSIKQATQKVKWVK